MAERAHEPLGVTLPGARSWTLDSTERAIIADALLDQAATLESWARTNSPHRTRGDHLELMARVQVLRREADRLRRLR